MNFLKYTYGRSKYIVIINVNKNSFRDWVGSVKNSNIFYSHCECPTLIVISINEENILQAFKVIPKTVICTLPMMWKSKSTIGFTRAEVCHNQASNCNDNVIACMKSCAHATELSTCGLNHNHKVKGPVSMVDAGSCHVKSTNKSIIFNLTLSDLFEIKGTCSVDR